MRQTTVAAVRPEWTRLIQIRLVEPEVVRRQKSLKFGEKLVVVEAVNGLNVTGTVVQISCDLQSETGNK